MTSNEVDIELASHDEAESLLRPDLDLSAAVNQVNLGGLAVPCLS